MRIPIIFAYSCYTANALPVFSISASSVSPCSLFPFYYLLPHSCTAPTSSRRYNFWCWLLFSCSRSNLELKRETEKAIIDGGRSQVALRGEKSKLCSAFLYGKQSAPNTYGNCFASWLWLHSARLRFRLLQYLSCYKFDVPLITQRGRGGGRTELKWVCEFSFRIMIALESHFPTTRPMANDVASFAISR